MPRKLLTAVTRFAEGATREERALFARVLIAALDSIGVKPGEEFVIAHPDVFDPAPGDLGPFARDSETSRQAAIENYPRAGTQRQRVLDEVHRRGEKGATRDELAVELKLPLATICPRVWES